MGDGYVDSHMRVGSEFFSPWLGRKPSIAYQPELEVKVPKMGYFLQRRKIGREFLSIEKLDSSPSQDQQPRRRYQNRRQTARTKTILRIY
jgi:hypothetical protein